MSASKISKYFSEFTATVDSTEFSDKTGEELGRDDAFDRIIRIMSDVVNSGAKIFFCGNGGSAGICSHMATDFSKNGKVPSLAMNDSSALTCIANDYGFEFVFSKQLEMFAGADDTLFAISSSGNSQNILNAVNTARDLEMDIVTFSGFSADNQLRRLGDINVFVPGQDYGFVEVAHLSLIHALLDLHMGWPNIKYP